MSHSAHDLAAALRSRGLRSTPQRRAILAAFAGGQTEHLSADEVHAVAVLSVPDLSRATVYSTLGEFVEAGLLGAVGAAEPVRYETNVEPHVHFRCRLCQRLFDLAGASPPSVAAPGYVVERVDTRAEGVCASCGAYDRGLAEGVRAIATSGPAVDVLALPGLACAAVDGGPLGPLLLAATGGGLVRLAFAEHGDAPALQSKTRGRRGSRAAHEQLDSARSAVSGYLAGESRPLACTVDWPSLAAANATALQATRAIGYGERRSYSKLPLEDAARALGRCFGANPIPIVTPCHRVSRGVEVPRRFVGGPERRRWLLEHEQRS